jgi:hypothetical protein
MSRFSEYVTSTAFSMSLSQSMVQALCGLYAAENAPERARCRYMGWALAESHAVMTLRALSRRGLLNRKEEGEVVSLSDAGRAIVPLLKLAGLYHVPELDAPAAETIPDTLVEAKP